MPCPRCPFFSGEVPADVCARCSRARGRGASSGALLAGLSLFLLCWAAGHTLAYFFTGTFWAWRTPAFAAANTTLPLPGDYGGVPDRTPRVSGAVPSPQWLWHVGDFGPLDFPVDLSAFPAYGVVLGLLYGILSAVPALAACLLGLWGGVVLALASWAWVPAAGGYPAVLLAGAVVAGLPWGGARWWRRRLALGVGLPTAFVVAAHVVSAARSHLAADLLPGAVAAAVVVGLVLLWYREVRLRSLRLFPVTVATLLLLVSSPLLFSLTVTFPYHSYQLLWDRFSLESLCGRPSAAADGDLGPTEGGASSLTTVADFDGRRAEAAARFAGFARRYPGSPFAPEVLIHEARLLNLRATATAEGRLQFFEDRIAAKSLPIYAGLIKLAPASVAAARARLEEARWSLENGRFDEARERYHDILVTYETHIAPDYEPPARLLLQGVCRRAGCSPRLTPPGARPDSGRPFSPEELRVAYYEAYLTARQALAFLAGNGQVEGEPLRLFLRLSPSAADYAQRLEELLLLYPEDVYPDLGLLDDIQVALARGLPDEAQRLTQLLTRRARGDGTGRALYRLAELARSRGDSSAAERYLRRLGEEAGWRRHQGGSQRLSLEVAWAQALLGEGREVRPPWPQPFP